MTNWGRVEKASVRFRLRVQARLAAGCFGLSLAVAPAIVISANADRSKVLDQANRAAQREVESLRGINSAFQANQSALAMLNAALRRLEAAGHPSPHSPAKPQ